MPSANKDRIRVTLHVDRKIYALVKMWSEIDQKPISRLFDEVFKPHVERFEKFGSFFDYKHSDLEEEMENHISDELLEEMDRKDKERKRISKMTKKEQEKHYQKFIEFMKQEEERQQKEEEEYDNRWIKAHSKMQKKMS